MTLLETGMLVVLNATLGMWFGAMVFFSFIGAPTTFDVLDGGAGQVVNAIFPKYYEFGEILGFTAVSAAIIAGSEEMLESISAFLVAPLVLVALAATIYANARLIPKMEEAGDEGFAKYHKQSVILNGVTMLAVAGALVLSHL
ncbi:DUF4149 domain-containing protein [Haladaptatus pallidirubidus]|uniref:TMEM205-like domain-containing protein n=1 Tax=Haladaptatus pallidirubidus TaxID=1008152 RepID=A0AAV3UBL6_9EURY|nr:DUF4149 domain-containing protein [Haladaptatus pallidirubidus]